MRIGIVAGEASGDVLAAGLIKSVRLRYPDAIIEGVGGDLMQAEGFHSLFDMNELSVMGLVEVLKHLPRLLHIRKAVTQHFLQNPPDVFIGVDAPDFNLAVEAKLKQHGIKTIHYVSPTVWAWRESRIHKIAKATNLVLGVFPFEKEVYQKYQVPFTFVGHTMADILPMIPDRKEARAAFNIDEKKPVLAILPGSRAREIETLLPIFLKTATLLVKSQPDLLILIPAANAIRKTQIEQCLRELPDKLNIVVIDGNARNVMIASNAVLLTSGTASLEAMLCKRPMVVAYTMSKLTYRIMQRLYKPKYFSLPNILAGDEIVPEVLQEKVNPRHLASLLEPLFSAPPQSLINVFNTLHTSLRHNADEQAAQAAISVALGDKHQ